MLLLAAFQTLLLRYTGESDIVVGCPTSDRNDQTLEHLIGFFVQVLPVRSDLSGNPRFRDVLKQVLQKTLAAQELEMKELDQLEKEKKNQLDQIQSNRQTKHHSLPQLLHIYI